MSHLLKESPDDEHDLPDPSDEFLDEWLERHRDKIIFDNLEVIDAAWEKHLNEHE